MPKVAWLKICPAVLGAAAALLLLASAS